MVPEIAYELDDGYQACVAGPLAWTIQGLMQKLSSADRREFEEQMSDAYGVLPSAEHWPAYFALTLLWAYLLFLK